MIRICSWSEVNILCRIISDSITASKTSSNKNFNKILAIPRGGLIPSRLLSEYLNIQTIIIDDKDIKHDDNILIVDDISDSGKTLVSLLQNIDCRYMVATIFVRAGTKYYPHFLGEFIQNDDWIQFPWELQ